MMEKKNMLSLMPLILISNMNLRLWYLTHIFHAARIVPPHPKHLNNGGLDSVTDSGFA